MPTIFKTWQFWIGFGVSLLLLSFLISQVDVGEVRKALGEANYVYLVPAIALYFLSVYFRSTRWQYILRPLQSVPVTRLYPVVIIGYMANNLLPARLGELVRSYYLARRERFSASSALATVAVERLYDGIILLVFAALSALVLLALGEFESVDGISRTIGTFAAGFSLVGLIGGTAILTAISSNHRGEIFAGILARFLPVRLQAKFIGVANNFLEGLAILSCPRKHLALFIFSIPVWALEVSMHWVVSYSFGIDGYFGSIGVLILVVALVTATSNLATAIPSSVGGIGPFEVAGQQTLILLGVGASVAGAYMAFIHLVAFWLPINIVGLLILWKQNVSLGQLIRPQAAEAAEQESPET